MRSFLWIKFPSNITVGPPKRRGDNFRITNWKQNLCFVKGWWLCPLTNVLLLRREPRETGPRQVCSLEERGPRKALCVVSHCYWLHCASALSRLFLIMELWRKKERGLSKAPNTWVKYRRVHFQLVGTGSWAGCSRQPSVLTGAVPNPLAGARTVPTAKFLNIPLHWRH